MPRNIADDTTIINAVRKVMSIHSRINSQSELARLVLEEMRSADPAVRVGSARIRKLAVSSGSVKIEIEYRDSDRKYLPSVCPVCGNGMTSVLNNTLTGELTEIKRSCTVCPYSMGKEIVVPGRYAFVRAFSNVSDEEQRIRKLKKAASLLRGAEKLIHEALEGTNFPQRGEYSREMIEEILTSKEMTGSIPNLLLDIIQENHSDPLWTKSFSTPKYPDKKHI